MATYDAGIVTAYGAAVRGGYTGTYEEFCAQQAGYAQNAVAVEQAKQDAQAAAQAAEKMIAEEYDETETYHIGDLVVYDGKLQRCNAEITTPEAYNRSHWSYFTVEDALDNLEQGNVYTSCNTAEDDLNKTAMLYNYGITNYALKKFGLVAVRFINAVKANSTLNINETGAREIYKGTAPITDGVIKAGDTALFMLNGVGRFVFLGVDTYGDKIDSLTNDVYNTLVTDTASGSIASFPDGADGIPVKSLTVNIEPVQSGSGDPSPDNVRPISGHTQAVVTRTGKNLFDGIIENGTIDDYGNNASQANRYRSQNYISVKPNQRYLFSKNGARQTVNWRLYDINKTFMSGINIGSNPFTVPDGCYYLRFFSDDVINVTSGLQLEHGETPTAYESSNVATVTIDLGGTRYGGTLNLDTGTLTDKPRWFATVDRAIVDLGTLNWTYSERYFYATTPYPVPVYNAYSAYANAICSAYRVEKFGTMYNNYSTVDKCFSINNGSPNDNVVRIRDTSYADAASFKTAMNGVQLCYELATPQTIQLTANEISTLLGQNNIWSDTGDVEVTYRADTKLYIEKLTAPTEDDMIADHAISANTFFMIGNTLYRATTAIASGATITVGTNATKLSLSDALNALS